MKVRRPQIHLHCKSKLGTRKRKHKKKIEPAGELFRAAKRKLSLDYSRDIYICQKKGE